MPDPIQNPPANDLIFDTGDIWSAIEKPKDPPADPPAPTDKKEPPVDPAKKDDEKKEDKPAEPDGKVDLWKDPTDKKDEDPKDEDEKDEDGKINSFKAVNKLIEEEVLLGFTDGKPIKSYKDLKFVISEQSRMNYEQGSQDGIKSLIDKLPDEGKMVVDYIINGGENLRDEVLIPLLQVKQVASLDVSTETGKEKVVLQGLIATLGMSEEEAIAELKIYKDANLLDSKSAFYKTKLETINAKILEDNLKKTASTNAERTRVAAIQKQIVQENVDMVFSKDTIFGLPVDKVTKGKLKKEFLEVYNSSIDPNRQLDAIEAALEHYKYIKPNYELLAAVKWMMTDPKGYHAAYLQEAQKNVIQDNRRQLDGLEKKNRILNRPE